MRPNRLRSASLAAIALVAFAVPTLRAADVDPSAPESAVLPTVKALRGNDFKALFATLPAADQAKAQEQWKQAQAKPDAAGDADFDQFLGQLLAPDAVDQLMAKAEPKLKGLDLTKLSQGAIAFSGFLPMLAQQSGKPLGAEDQRNLAMLQNLLNDVAAWIPKSGLNDPKKLRAALEHVVAGAKALGVKDAKEMHALAFDEVLTRLGPMLKEVKAAIASYDLQVDQFLDSVKATSSGDGDQRTLAVTFTAFGRPYDSAVKVEKKDGHWVVAKDAAPSALDAFKGMLPSLPGAGAAPGQGEGAGEVK